MSSVGLTVPLTPPPPPQRVAISNGFAPATAVASTRRYDSRIAGDLAAHRMSSLFSSERWVEAVGATYNFHFQASVLERDGRAVAGIYFSEVEDIRGRRVISLPFSDYVDPLVDDAGEWAELIESLVALEAPVRFRCLRSAIPPADSRFKLTGDALWHAADLTVPEAEAWSALDGSARQNIRKAQRSGVTVRVGRTIVDLEAFYGMHRHVRKSKYRLFAQPFSFFEALHAAFAPDDRIFALLAEHDGVVLGGILFLIHGDTLYYKFNASTDTEFRPNDLLVWTGMRIGRERGLSRLDFGLSDTEQPGLVRFKRKFASEERTISILQFSPEAYADRRGEEAGRVLHSLTQILTSPETPDDVTRAVGDQVYRFFC